jgi:hypothetical protein
MAALSLSIFACLIFVAAFFILKRGFSKGWKDGDFSFSEYAWKSKPSLEKNGRQLVVEGMIGIFVGLFLLYWALSR